MRGPKSLGRLAPPYPDGKVRFYDGGSLTRVEDVEGASRATMTGISRADPRLWHNDESYWWADQVRQGREKGVSHDGEDEGRG